MEPAVGPIQGDKFTLNNELGYVHVGVNCELNSGGMVPCFLSKQQVMNGKDDLTPKVEILVWFDQSLTTGSMFSHSVSLTAHVDMTNNKNKTITWIDVPDSYEHAGMWSEGGVPALP